MTGDGGAAPRRVQEETARHTWQAGTEGQPGEAPTPIATSTLGVGILLGAVTMFFVGLTSAMLARRAGADWTVGPLPAVLWVNTALLLLSSVTLEWARKRVAAGSLRGAQRATQWTVVLGLAFLIGQVMAWRQLVSAGVYLAANPHSAFFYLLTAAHGVHLLGGVIALARALYKVQRARAAQEVAGTLGATALYWHYMDGLWLYLFGLLFLV